MNEAMPPLSVSQGSFAARIFISTGEVSGDLQGAMLIDALKRQAQLQGITLELLALGGDRMAAAGATLLGNTSTIGSIGLFEAVPYILPTWKIQQRAKHYLRQHPPDLAILIDHVGSNVPMGNYLAKHLPSVPIVHYIAPQEWVWAFNSYSTDRIVAVTERILAVFPEEANYFRRKGAQVTWVGHPLVDRMQTAPSRDSARATLGIAPDQIAIVLLPASRRQELKSFMPIMFEAAKQIQATLPQVHFWVPLALEDYRHAIEQAIQHYGLQATVLAAPEAGKSSSNLLAIAAADLAITKSGTVSLEIALLKVPQVVLYKVNPVTAWIARRLNFSVPFVSLPNLIEMQPIVPEFFQENATPENLIRESLDLLLNTERRQTMLAGYESMSRAIGEPGVCDRAAKEILALLRQKSKG